MIYVYADGCATHVEKKEDDIIVSHDAYWDGSYPSKDLAIWIFSQKKEFIYEGKDVKDVILKVLKCS